jgi:hypothetical protein
MRAHTKKKHGMGKRFAVVIGAAAAGVMALGALALGAQTGAGGAPHLKLSGHTKQIGPRCTDPPRCGVPRAVSVSASCGEVNGPPVPWAPGLLKELRPPANVPDLGCHLSAEGKVMGDKLRHGIQAGGVDLPGPGVGCEGHQESGSFALTTCHWFSGSRALMQLELREKTLKQVGSALDDGNKVLAKVTVRAKYASGKVATAKRTITLVLGHKGAPLH